MGAGVGPNSISGAGQRLVSEEPMVRTGFSILAEQALLTFHGSLVSTLL